MMMLTFLLHEPLGGLISSCNSSGENLRVLFTSVDVVLPAVGTVLTALCYAPTTSVFSWEFTLLPALADTIAASPERTLSSS